ncbi:MAG: universal stress protein, partial [Armatimonadota bacterium]
MRILLATDGSKSALAAARFLATLRLGADTEVQVLRVLEHDEGDPEAYPALDAAERALSGTEAKLRRSIRRGRAVQQVLDAAKAVAADARGASDDALVAIGDHGHTPLEHLFLGSVAERVVRHAPVAVLVARPVREKLDRIVVALDGSDGAMQAVAYLARLPLPAGVSIRLVGVVLPAELVSATRFPFPGLDDVLRGAAQREQAWMRDHLEGAVAVLRGTGHESVEAIVREGDPTTEVLAEAEEQDADLIVAGAR